MKKIEIGWACGMYGGEKWCVQGVWREKWCVQGVWRENLKEKSTWKK
jgi:hypothetical protein